MTQILSRSPPTRFACSIALVAFGVALAWLCLSPQAVAAAEPAANPAPAAEVPAAERKWKEIKPDQALQKTRTQVTKILTSGQVPADQRQLFDDYYTKYSLPRWTLEASQSALPKLRTEVRNDLRMAKFGEVHNRLTELLLAMLEPWTADPEMSTPVRTNAVLMIGELYSDDRTGPTLDPVPLPQAVPTLLKLLDDPKQIDAVRVAALVGLKRHAGLGIANPQVAAGVGESMLKLAMTPSAAGRSPAGQLWMRGRAIEILGLLGNIGTNNAVANALGEIAGDPNASIMVRRAAAEALAKLNYAPAVNINGAKIAAGLLRLASASIPAAKQELGQGKAGAGRRMKSTMYSVARGLKGLADGLKDPVQKKAAEDARAKVQKLVEAGERVSDDDKVVRAYEALAKELAPPAVP